MGHLSGGAECRALSAMADQAATHLTHEECVELRLAAICSVDMTTGPSLVLDSALRKLKVIGQAARG